MTRLAILQELAEGTPYAIATKDERYRLRPAPITSFRPLDTAALITLAMCLAGIVALVAVP